MLCTVWHTENGGDSPRISYEVPANTSVEIWIGTWPIELGQSVWIEYRQDGGNWKKIPCNWQYNSNMNSYWRGFIPGLPANTLVEYKVNARQGDVKIPQEGEYPPCPCPCLYGPFKFRVSEKYKPAPGQPGEDPVWTTGAKNGVGTAFSDRSKVWFTLSKGLVNEIYFPTVDKANSRDFQFLVSDGRTFADDTRYDMDHEIQYIDDKALAYRLINTDKDRKYRIIQNIITDPDSDSLVIQVTYEPLTDDAQNYKVYALLNPHMDNSGMNDRSRHVCYNDKDVLLSYQNGIYSAFLTSCPVNKYSCGFVGKSDGYKDLKEDYRMDWEYTEAKNGNTAVMFELDLSQSKTALVVIGYGQNEETSLRTAYNTIIKDYREMERKYIEEWRDYCASLNDLDAYCNGNGKLAYISAMVLKAYEDKTFKGAMIASLSIPWGDSAGDSNSGGYHLVWSRDLYHAATAFMAIGYYEGARRALNYLDTIQQEQNGSFPQNSWLNGEPYWGAEQLDEASYPIILAWRLYKEGKLGYDPYYSLVKPAAEFITHVGPGTPQERWEEVEGLSPSTIAAEIAALVCAAKFAEAQVSKGDYKEQGAADWYYKKADEWANEIEDWCFVKKTGCLGDGYYFLRTNPDSYYDFDPSDTTKIRLKNGAGEFLARDIIDASFLELVRLGIRSPEEKSIVESLPEVDEVLRVEIPNGSCFYRYNHDCYGEYDDGRAYDGCGVGRLWPILTGERGHYELVSGKNIDEYVRAMERFANDGYMLPEQVWDKKDEIPERGLFFGRGTGSATPLAWSHAEYLKLIRSRFDGKVFDTIPEVQERYCK
jgi:glucoamylase